MSDSAVTSKYRLLEIPCGPEYGQPSTAKTARVLYSGDDLDGCLDAYEHHRSLSGTGTEAIVVVDPSGFPLYACS